MHRTASTSRLAFVTLHGFSILAGIILLVDSASAQLPAARLEGVFPAGAKAGSTAEVTIAGVDLDDADKLIFSHPGITAQRKMTPPGPFDEGPQPALNQFMVTVNGDVPIGVYEVRTQGKYGITNPRSFEIGAIPEQLETEPNNTLEQAQELTAESIRGGLVLNGQANAAADVDWFRLPVVRGQRLVLRLTARRLDSQMDPVLTVLDSLGRQIAEERDATSGEPVVDFTASSEGRVVLKVADSLFRGGGAFAYRLSIGAIPQIDFVFPPAGLAGTNASVTLFGRQLPGGQPAGISLDGHPLEKLNVSVPLPGPATEWKLTAARVEPYQAGMDAVEYRLPSPQGPSNPVLVSLASATPVLEQEPNNAANQAQRLTVPCEVAGQFYPQRDQDWFTFDAKQSEVIILEVLSHRLGVPTNPALVVQRVTKNDKGEELMTLVARVDDVGNRDGGYEFDNRSNDPVFRLVAPEDGTYRVLVQDSLSRLRNDPRLVYRFALRRPQPDFRLAAVPNNSSGAVLLRKGGRETIRVVAFRQDDYAGEIRVSATGLPDGVTSLPAIIGPGSQTASLTITAADGAPASLGNLRIVGVAPLNGQEVTRVAIPAAATVALPLMQPGQVMPTVASRVTRSLVVGVSAGEVAPVLLSAGADKVWETARGGIVKIPFAVTRRANFQGPIVAFPTDLPPNVNAPQFNIDGGAASGEFQINLTAATTPGTYTFYVNGFAQNYSYRRNPEAAEAATARKAKVDKIAVDMAEKAKVATEAAAKAAQALTQADAQLKAMTEAKNTADKVSTEAATAAKTAADQAAAAKKAAAAQTNDANLATAAANAEKVSTEAALKAKMAAEQLVTAMKNLEQAQTTFKTATETKTVADKAAQDAVNLSQQAQQLKQQTDQRTQQLINEANPRNVNSWTPSTPITIKIAEFPITQDGPPPAATLKQGANLEIPLTIARLYGFDGPITVQALPPGNAAGLQPQNPTIAQGQTQGKLTFAAQPTATPGTYAVTVRTLMNFNGQPLQFDRTLNLTVEAAAAK